MGQFDIHEHLVHVSYEFDCVSVLPELMFAWFDARFCPALNSLMHGAKFGR